MKNDVLQAAMPTMALRAVLGQYATGVTVVTTLGESGEPLGLTVNSFSALSLDPPLVLWSLRLGSSLLPAFKNNPAFEVNVLAHDQEPVSRLFASKQLDKFSQVPHTMTADGRVRLNHALAWLACTTVSHQTAGDHELFIAKVDQMARVDGLPLLFFGGNYHQMSAPATA